MQLASAKLFSAILLSALLFSANLPAQEDSPPPSARIFIENIPAAGFALTPSIAVVDNKLVGLYVTAEGRIALRRGDDSRTLDDHTDRPGGRYVGLYVDGDRLYALWWQKQPDGKKHLYFRVSSDGGETFSPFTIINVDNDMLPPYDVAFDGQGNVAVIYNDERRPRHLVYVNRSTDGGKTWLEQDIRLDRAPLADEEKNTPPPFAVEPQILFHDGKLIATWKERFTGEGGEIYTRVLSRLSEDKGLNWQPEVEIARNKQHFFTSEVLLSHGDQVFLIGFQPQQGLLAYRSRDSGRHWESLGALPGSADAGAISQIKAASQGDKLFVAYTFEQYQTKSQVHLATLSAKTGQWQSEIHRLDRGKPYDSTQALAPELLALANGTVMLTWTDYRHIYPTIYLDYSTNGGKTWREDPLPLDEPGKYISQWSSLIPREEGVAVLFDRFDSVFRERRDVMYRTLSFESESGLAGLPRFKPPVSQEEKEQRLRERAKQFWQLRVEGQFAETYDFYDPAFRQRYNRSQFTMQQGQVEYESFEIVDVALQGNVAGVAMEVQFAVPEIVTSGQKTEIESKKETFRTRWVWIHDQWYTLFSAFGRKPLLDF